MIKTKTPILGFIAYSGTGKTTLLKKIIPIMVNKNVRVGIIKHAHHAFDIDQPGKDSYELRKAGAAEMLIGSVNRWALMADAEQNHQYTLDDHIQRLDQDSLDLILIEGFKLEDVPKIELTRSSLGNDYFFQSDNHVVAIATDEKLTISTTLPILDINNPEEIASFICDNYINNNSK